MQTHREAWAEDIRTSYGGGETPEELFVRHTYLALLTRLLAFAALEHRALSDSEAETVLDGTFFVGRRIANFVEDDYFQWPLLASKLLLRHTWGAMVAQLRGYQLASVREDVLKPLYEQLVDPDTRHDLGEYYTPDWLAAEVAEAALQPWFDAGERPRVLDPACGSGSFLRAVIHSLRQAAADKPKRVVLAAILESVVGMDVNPLAVTVSKATYLLAIADLIPTAEDVVNLPVYLCNSLSAQERTETSSLFGNETPLTVGTAEFLVPLDLIQHGPDFDHAIAEVVSTARSFAATHEPASAASAGVRARLSGVASRYSNQGLILDSLAAMTAHMVELIRTGRDTIHGFLLRNKYRSVLLSHQFDLVIGNPPWLTIADISAPTYRELVLRRARESKLTGRSAGEQAHSELATLFLGQAFSQYLADRGDDSQLPRVAFVMPRSIFSATHHRALREGSYAARFDITSLWDLDAVTPLFNVPSCVLFAVAGPPRPDRPKAGRVFRGRLGSRDPDVGAAHKALEREDVEFYLGRLGRRTAWVLGAARDSEVVAPASSPYQARFRQGAVLYPQSLLCVQPIGAAGRGPGDVAVRSDRAACSAAKVLADVDLHAVVERSCLFSSAAAQHVVPYALADGLLTVILPVLADPGDPDFAVCDPATLRHHGRIGTADWFDNAERLWEQVQSRPGPPIWERLDHLGHLRAQAKRSRWLVLYTSAGSRPVATAVDSTTTEYPLVVRDQTYWASFFDPCEAHYVAAALNSDRVAELIKAFMTRGLFGPRHIHKRVLDVPIPRFDPDDGLHQGLAAVGERLAEAASQFVLDDVARGSSVRRRVRAALSPVDLDLVEEHVSRLLEQVAEK